MVLKTIKYILIFFYILFLDHENNSEIKKLQTGNDLSIKQLFIINQVSNKMTLYVF